VPEPPVAILWCVQRILYIRFWYIRFWYINNSTHSLCLWREVSLGAWIRYACVIKWNKHGSRLCAHTELCALDKRNSRSYWRRRHWRGLVERGVLTYHVHYHYYAHYTHTVSEIDRFLLQFSLFMSLTQNIYWYLLRKSGTFGWSSFAIAYASEW